MPDGQRVVRIPDDCQSHSSNRKDDTPLPVTLSPLSRRGHGNPAMTYAREQTKPLPPMRGYGDTSYIQPVREWEYIPPISYPAHRKQV